MMISTVDRLRLAALLGMLGSSHVGERENAAQLVEQFRRQRGLSWADLLGRRPADERASGPEESSTRQSSPLEDRPPPIGRVYRAREMVWRWSMTLGLAAVALMSLTSLAQQHAAEKRIAARVDGPCPDGDCAGSGGGVRPAAGLRADFGSGGDAMPKPFTQGVADRKVFEAWRSTAAAGPCSGRRSIPKQWTLDCSIARKLVAQFEQRRRADPVYLAGWNSPPQ
jgi:hypothetical protein